MLSQCVLMFAVLVSLAFSASHHGHFEEQVTVTELLSLQDYRFTDVNKRSHRGDVPSGPERSFPNDGESPPSNRKRSPDPQSNRGPYDHRGHGPPSAYGPPERQGSPQGYGPPDLRGPPDGQGPPRGRGPFDWQGPPHGHGPPNEQGPPGRYKQPYENGPPPGGHVPPSDRGPPNGNSSPSGGHVPPSHHGPPPPQHHGPPPQPHHGPPPPPHHGPPSPPHHGPPPRSHDGPSPYYGPPPPPNHGPPSDDRKPPSPQSYNNYDSDHDNEAYRQPYGHSPPHDTYELAPQNRGPPLNGQGQPSANGQPGGHGPHGNNGVQPGITPSISSAQNTENEQILQNLKLIFRDGFYNTAPNNQTKNDTTDGKMTEVLRTEKPIRKGGQTLTNIDANTSDSVTITQSPHYLKSFQVVPVTPES
ncbi:basic proline-rich protein-like isoform X1 [Cydia fagiglandana]|uniref:basic proline-rich protein-like isoform X1 n=1 Tax=Cydia fagiglandana TaxID=1458189 RepID=UPI002FEE18F1